MKYNCELIQDLLPLYEEGLCSPTSRQIVQEHLSQCADCRRLAAPLSIEEPKDTPEADRAVKKCMRKVRRRWLASLVTAVLLVPMLLLGFNQYRGHGLCFTNWDDAFTAWRYLHALQTRNWDTAAGLWDFSDDYGSIREVLEWEVSDWGIHAVSTDLLGYEYMAKASLREYDAIPATLSDLYGFLYNRWGNAMIPLDLWEQLTEQDPAAFSQEGWQYWLNGERYGKITTDWGEFMVIDGRSYDSAYDYVIHFDLFPAAVYADALPAIDAEALRLYTATHADLDWVGPLTEEEFEEEMRRRYLADLRSLADTVTFDCTGFRDIGRTSDGWYVIFDVTVTYEASSLVTRMQLSVLDGRVTVAGLSCDQAPQWLCQIEKVLYPSAHPGY